MDRKHARNFSSYHSRKHKSSPSQESMSPDESTRNSEKRLRLLKERARKEMTHNSRDRYRNDEDNRKHRSTVDERWRPHHQANRYRNRSRSPKVKQEPQDYDSKEFKNFRSKRRDDDRRPLKFNSKSDGETKQEDQPPPPEIKPNFELTGALARDTNTFNGIVVKYSEPPEAKKPIKRWRLYPFKGNEALDFIAIYRQSAFLLGRDRKVADIAIDHPSCSKQHAAIQFRSIEYERSDGSLGRRTKPYIIDLESANGTFVNNKRIDAKRFVELFEQDVLKFGFSTREYVLLHDQSSQSQNDDDEEEAQQQAV